MYILGINLKALRKIESLQELVNKYEKEKMDLQNLVINAQEDFGSFKDKEITPGTCAN